MSPVLLDQRRLLAIVVAGLCALIITFYAGYFAGTRNAETSLPQAVERLELNLPEAPAVTAPVSGDALVPEVSAPGVDIDVDTADPRSASPSLTPAGGSNGGESIVRPSPPAAEAGKIAPAEAAIPDPVLGIVDDATRDDARFSIQVCIYGSLNNAEKQVASLAAQDLSAYYQAYQNQKYETRYRVRFGYFASHASASHALALWQKNHPASNGYLVQLSD
jgi:cell division septation protein DedD